MATHKSAIKEHRQSLVRRSRNRYARSRLRTAVKQLRRAIAAGDVDGARRMLPRTISLLDRTAKTRAIHPNAADRHKARLSRAVSRLGSASPAS